MYQQQWFSWKFWTDASKESMRTSSIRLYTAIVVAIEVVKKDRYNYTFYTWFHKNIGFLCGILFVFFQVWDNNKAFSFCYIAHSFKMFESLINVMTEDSIIDFFHNKFTFPILHYYYFQTMCFCKLLLTSRNFTVAS